MTSTSNTPDVTSPPRTAQPLFMLVRLDMNDFYPHLLQLVHISILAIQLMASLLLIIEIRGSPRYSMIDKSLAGLLEKDINDLIKLRQDIRYLKTPTVRWNERHSIGHSTFTDWSPHKRTLDETGEGTPRRRSRTSSNNTSLITPSAPSKQNIDLEIETNHNKDKGYEFNNQDNIRRSSKNNRRLSVRFDLSRHLEETISPRTELFVNPALQDYFSLPITTSEVTRPIPLSIVNSSKEANGFSPCSNGSETLEDILEEEHDHSEQKDNAWMDVRGEESV
nr:uncharacterized protein I206_05381 [Kwoniella pini CBS 10737]OCF48601.1 hypothetical protein I206_05381 [Kwoniella pini CBS 10737]